MDLSQINSNSFKSFRTCLKSVLSSTPPFKVPGLVLNQLWPYPQCINLFQISSNSLQRTQTWPKSILHPSKVFKRIPNYFCPLQKAKTCSKSTYPPSNVSWLAQNKLWPPPKCQVLPLISCNSLQIAWICPKLILTTYTGSGLVPIHF